MRTKIFNMDRDECGAYQGYIWANNISVPNRTKAFVRFYRHILEHYNLTNTLTVYVDDQTPIMNINELSQEIVFELGMLETVRKQKQIKIKIEGDPNSNKDTLYMSNAVRKHRKTLSRIEKYISSTPIQVVMIMDRGYTFNMDESILPLIQHGKNKFISRLHDVSIEDERKLDNLLPLATKYYHNKIMPVIEDDIYSLYILNLETGVLCREPLPNNPIEFMEKHIIPGVEEREGYGLIHQDNPFVWKFI